MAAIGTQALVLKRIDFRETSVLLDLLTLKLGKVRGVLKGVRNSRSRVSPLCFNPGSYIFLCVYPRRNSNLMLLHAPQLIQSFQMEEVKSSGIWQRMLRMVNLFLPEQERNEEILRLLLESGKAIKQGAFPAVVYLWFKMKMVVLLGYGLELDRCLFCRKNKGSFYISTRLGGIVCPRCGLSDSSAMRISPAMLRVMRSMERISAKHITVIKMVPAQILENVNFVLNLVLHYHSDPGYIWWQDEKNIFKTCGNTGRKSGGSN